MRPMPRSSGVGLSGGSRPRAAGVAAGLGLALAACGGGSSGSQTYDFGDSGAGLVVGAGTGVRAPGVAGHDAGVVLSEPDGGGSGDCPASARLIYVTGEGAKLYSFDPEAGKFTLIGPLSCLSSPTHMTVDRQGAAWVVEEGGSLYKASTTNATCSKVTSWPLNATSYPDFALTFLGTTTAPDTTLYVLGDSGELGAFDILTGHVAPVGTVSVHPFGDMTTNGDGTLYFLVQGVTQTLNQIDPSNAAVRKTYTTGLDSENSQALAYYGGLFYDFIGDAVSTFDPVTGKTTPLGTAPLLVTGAGQSTCVPTTAPPPAPLR